ncbi:hypothetical protein ACQP3J_32110, partial [Escherichia coli]
CTSEGLSAKRSKVRLEREGNELGWQGPRRWYKEVGSWVEQQGQLNPNTLDSDSSYLGNFIDYLGVLLSCAQIFS